MVIHYFLDNGDLNLIALFGKNKAVWMDKIDSVFTTSILGKRMATANPEADHFFNRIGSRNFIDTLMYFFCHSGSVSFCCFLSIGTHLFNALVFVLNIQSITPSSVYLTGKFIVHKRIRLVNTNLPMRLIAKRRIADFCHDVASI